MTQTQLQHQKSTQREWQFMEVRNFALYNLQAAQQDGMSLSGWVVDLSLQVAPLLSASSRQLARLSLSVVLTTFICLGREGSRELVLGMFWSLRVHFLNFRSSPAEWNVSPALDYPVLMNSPSRSRPLTQRKLLCTRKPQVNLGFLPLELSTLVFCNRGCWGSGSFY